MIVATSVPFRFMAFYVTEQPSSSSRLTERHHHPPFFRTPYSKPLKRLNLADYRSSLDIDYICSLRPICEVLFYFLLLTYNAGVKAYRDSSMENHTQGSRPRLSTAGWKEAHSLASQALSQAMIGTMLATSRDPAAEEEAEKALEYLHQRFYNSVLSFRSQN